MEAKGTIHKIFNTQTFDSGFSKREFVLKIAENPDYPQFVKFELTKDKCALLDDCAVGQELTVAFNLNGREWIDPKGEAKYFNTLTAWKIEKGAKAEAVEQEDWMDDNQDDDLGF